MQKQYFGQPSEDFDMMKSFEDSFASSLNPTRDEFGGTSKTYWDPMRRINKLNDIKNAMIQKASIDTSTGGAGTAGTALVPVWVDPAIVNRTVRETPLRNIFARRAVRGQTYDYIPLTAKGGAVFAAENGAVADQIDTYDRQSVTIKFAYAKGRVSGPAISSMRGFIDPSQLDLSVKSASLMELAEETILNGDASTNPEEYTGLIASITTNTTNLSGGLPTLAQIRAEFATVYNANGQTVLCVTDATTHNYIKGLLLDIQRQVTNPSESVLGFGIPDAFEFDGVMFIRDKFMPTSGSAKRILFLDTRYLFMAVLQDMTYEEKPSSTDSNVYWLKEYSAFVNTFESAQSQIYGIA